MRAVAPVEAAAKRDLAALTPRHSGGNVRVMSETFSKLFGTITRSSIWLEDDQTLRVWVTMLALSDRDGYVGASVGGLAATARVPREKTLEALEKFLAPDPDSRSQEHEGRRIEVADRGWTILNYARFRDMRDEEARKEYERRRKADQRSAMKDGKTYVYFAHDAGTGLVKIGYSSNPADRAKGASLRDAGAVGAITLLHTVPGSKDDERAAHMRYSESWVRGEWFRLDGALALFLSPFVPDKSAASRMSAHAEAESHAEADPDPSLRSGDNARRGFETLVRKEFAKRFQAAEGSLWTLAGDPAVAVVAAWLRSLGSDPRKALARLLDGFFADSWVRSRHYPIGHLSRHPQKYYEPRKTPAPVAQVDPAERRTEINSALSEIEGDLHLARMKDPVDLERVADLVDRKDALIAELRGLKSTRRGA